MVINISIHDSVENYSCHNVFNKNNINTFDVLTFTQMHTDENKFSQIGRSKFTHKKESKCDKKICARLVKNNSA